MIIEHDIIDRRKVTTVAKATASATFRDGLALGLAAKMQNFDQQVGQQGACAQYVAAPMLAYFYRGLRPRYYQSNNPLDVYGAQMVEAVHQSGLLQQHRLLAKHNVWSADIVTAIVLNLLLPEPPPNQNGESDQPPPEGDEQGEGEGSGGEGEGEGEGQGDGSDDDQQEGEGDGKGNGSGQDPQGESDGGSGGGDGKDKEQNAGSGDGKDGEGDKSGQTPGAGADTEQRDLVTEAVTAKGGDEAVAWHEYVRRVERRLTEAEHTLNTREDHSMNVVDGRRGEHTASPTLTEVMAKTKGQQRELASSPFGLEGKHKASLYLNAKRVTDRMGRLQSVLTGAMADRVKYAPSTPVKMTFGNNLSLALKHQFVHLGEETEPLLKKQWIGHELAQREVTGIVRAGKGPIIMCIDTSGSMFGTKMEWAMALAGAIGWAAAKRKREVAYVYYSSTVPDILHIPSKLRNDVRSLNEAIGSVVHNIGIGNREWHPYSIIDELNRKGITHKDGTPWVKQPNGGGTEYWKALEAALCVMLSNKSWRNADVLFLSDGADAGRSPHVPGRKRNVKTVAKKTRSNADRRGMSEGARIGYSYVRDLNRLGARVYGIALVQVDVGKKLDPAYKDVFADSMGYFNAYVAAAVNEKTDAADVLKVIGANL